MMMDDLEERLITLKKEIKVTGNDIMKQYEALHDPLSNLNIDLKNDPRNCIQALRYDFMDLLDIVAEKKDYLNKHSADLDECDHLTNILCNIQATTASITKCHESINNADILKTCKLFSIMNAKLKELPNDKTSIIGSGTTCRLLKREARLAIGRFQSRLRRLLDESISISIGHILVSKQLQGIIHGEDDVVESSIALKDIWEALEIITCDNENNINTSNSNCSSVAESIIKRLITNIMSNILNPLWSIPRGKNCTTRCSTLNMKAELLVDSVKEFDKSNSSNVETNITSKDTLCNAPFSQLLETVSQTISFLWKEILCNRPSLASTAAKAVLNTGTIGTNNINNNVNHKGGIIGRLLRTLNDLCPSSESEIISFRNSIENACITFEKNMIDLGTFGIELIDIRKSKSTGEVDDASIVGVLTSWLYNLRSSFCESKRSHILCKSRTILFEDYHNTIHASDEPMNEKIAFFHDDFDTKPAFATHLFDNINSQNYQISSSVSSLLNHIHDVADQACNLKDPLLAASLYRSIRDTLELFVSIMPTRFAKKFTADPRMSVVYYNDCVYLTHHVTAISCLHRTQIVEKEMKKESIVKIRGKNNKNIKNKENAKESKFNSDSQNAEEEEEEEKKIERGREREYREIVRQCTGLMDFIPRLRASAEKILHTEISKRYNYLMSMLLEINIYTGSTNISDMKSRYAGVVRVENTDDHSDNVMKKMNTGGNIELASSLVTSNNSSTASSHSHTVLETPAKSSNENDKNTITNSIESNTVMRTPLMGSGVLVGLLATGASTVAHRLGLGVRDRDQSQPMSGTNNLEASARFGVILETMRHDWYDVLPLHIYDRVTGHLIDSLLQPIIEQFLVSDVISENACDNIVPIFQTIQNAIEKILSHHSGNILESYVPNWCRFCVLTDLLQYSMSDIAEWYARRKFVCFSNKEMRQLIYALFIDSPRRQKVLKAFEE